MREQDFQGLARRVEALLARLDALAAENAALREQQTRLLAERHDLQRTNAQARARVESIIQRLKTLDTQV